MQHLYLNGEGNFKNKGELNKGGGKLTTDNVVAIKNLLKNKSVSQRIIAAMFNVSEATISEIKHNTKWVHIKVP